MEKQPQVADNSQFLLINYLCELNIENGIYLQGLNSLYKITGKTMENSDIGITRETLIIVEKAR